MPAHTSQAITSPVGLVGHSQHDSSPRFSICKRHDGLRAVSTTGARSQSGAHLVQLRHLVHSFAHRDPHPAMTAFCSVRNLVPIPLILDPFVL